MSDIAKDDLLANLEETYSSDDITLVSKELHSQKASDLRKLYYKYNRNISKFDFFFFAATNTFSCYIQINNSL